MIEKKERQILQFIKFAPVLATILISVCVTYFMVLDNSQIFQREIDNLKSEYLTKNKQRIQQEVNRVYDYILYQKQNSESNLKKNLTERVYEAYAIVNNIYLNNKDKSENEILKLIINALQEVRFNEGRGYFFIHKRNGLNLFHPIKSAGIHGKNLWDLKDINGKYIVRDMIETTRKTGEGYSEYHWFRVKKTQKQYRKIGFYKAFEPLDIIIGTAEYLDDFEEQLKKDILEYVNSIRYGKNGYMFIISYEKTTLSHINKKYIGLKYQDVEQDSHKKVLDDLTKISKTQGSGYLSYLGDFNHKRELITDKISYIKGFQPWQWSIGTGFYQDELASQVKQKELEISEQNETRIVNVLLIGLMLTIFLLVISLYVSKILESKFNAYRKQNELLTQQAKMASMGEMIANIAHQWRQPLNMISTAVTSIKFSKEFGVHNDKDEEEAYEHILKSTRHLSQTIDDFRNYFNPNKEKTVFQTREMYEKVLTFISSKFKNKDIQIIENIQDIKIVSFENELIQSIFNILNNAYDVFEERKLENNYLFVDIKQIKECAFINCETACDQKQGFVEITIRDNAGGIPSKVLPKIFEAYFTTKHQSQGTGIGLYMTYNIIKKNLYGHIEATNVEYSFENKKFKGAQFKIILPLSINEFSEV